MWDRLLGSGVLALALGYLYATYKLPIKDIGDPIGPQMFPYMIGIGTAICGVWILLEAVFKKQAVVDTSGADYVKPQPLAAVGIIIWAFIYFSLFEIFGFAISCSIFLIGMTSFFNRGKHKTNIAVSLIFSFSVYILFTQLLDVKLAPGPLPY